MKLVPALSLVLALAGLAALGQGGWIWAKAHLAQVLLERAWEKGQAGIGPVKPWPWADTHPVARLRVPSRGVELVVLDGASGHTLAFGPGRLHGSAPPGRPGSTVLSGHRDTHFRFLWELQPGDGIELEDATGTMHHYRVAFSEVVDARTSRVRLRAERPRLMLVTCWPMEAVSPGGPLRYVVTAEYEAATESVRAEPQ